MLSRFIKFDQNNRNSVIHNSVKKNLKLICAKQKLHKQLILINSENILTYQFQQKQRIQPNFNLFVVLIDVLLSPNIRYVC